MSQGERQIGRTMGDGTEQRRLWLVDGGEHIHLPGGFTLCWEIGPDGEAWPLIADDRLIGSTPRPDPADLAPHEQLGPAGADAVWELMVIRCGRPRSDGRPCRAVVRKRGDACWQHRDEAGL
jgi:hypothetical protein